MRESTRAKRSVYKACRYCDLSHKCHGKCFKTKQAKTKSRRFLDRENYKDSQL